VSFGKYDYASSFFLANKINIFIIVAVDFSFFFLANKINIVIIVAIDFSFFFLGCYYCGC
jgi:hypothetical protein